MASEQVKTITEDNFQAEVIASDVPVLIDFWAEWCGPCRMIAPIVEEIATENAGKLIVGKVNVDQNSNLATRHGIQSIPTLLLFKKGELVETIVGAMPKTQILSKITPHISG